MFSWIKFRFVRHRNTLLYMGSNVLLAAAGFIGSFVCTKLLLPEEFGAFQTASLIVTYLGFLQLGSVNGFNRNYPNLLGKGEIESATAMAQISYTVARIAALVAALIAFAQFLVFRHTGADKALILAGAAVIPLAALWQINSVQTAILVGRQLFGWLAKVQFAIASLTLILLALVWKFSVLGQCIRLVALAGLAWMAFSFKTAEAKKWRWNFPVVVELVKTGMPILAIGYLCSVFAIADRTLVASLKGTEAVGHYALAGLAIAAIQSVYVPLATAVYIKANHAYGKAGNISTLLIPVKRFLLLVTVAIVPFAICICLTLPWAVPWVLPKYVSGIRPAQIACLASVAFCYSGTGFVFNVTGHNRIYGILIGLAVGIFFLVGFLMPRQTVTLERVAWLRTFISIGICAILNGYLFFYLRARIRH